MVVPQFHLSVGSPWVGMRIFWGQKIFSSPGQAWLLLTQLTQSMLLKGLQTVMIVTNIFFKCWEFFYYENFNDHDTALVAVTLISVNLKAWFPHILISPPNGHPNIEFCLLIIHSRDGKYFLESLCSPALRLECVVCSCGFNGVCSIIHDAGDGLTFIPAPWIWGDSNYFLKT